MKTTQTDTNNNSSTDQAQQHDQRSSCALANSLDILGDRWSLLIIRDLMFTSRHEFGHFLMAGEGISTNILSERLERLQRWGLISKAPHPEHGKKFIYDLTDDGLKLAPTIIELALWGIDTIPDTMIPPKALEMMRNDRQALIEKINRRENLINL